MLRRGLEAGQAHFIEPKPKAEVGQWIVEAAVAG